MIQLEDAQLSEAGESWNAEMFGGLVHSKMADMQMIELEEIHCVRCAVHLVFGPLESTLKNVINSVS